jgi:hypothetical protein
MRRTRAELCAIAMFGPTTTPTNVQQNFRLDIKQAP